MTKIKTVRLELQPCKTQAEIAKRAKITTRAYQRYESGERVPNAYTAVLLAKALNTTVEVLFSTND